MRLLASHSDQFDPAAPWIQSQVLRQWGGPVFSQVLARRRSPHTGFEHDYVRLQGADWVNIVAFTPMDEDGELLVVEQFRHGIDKPTLEIPGGCCDLGEAPLQGAIRELREETGHAAGQWIRLGDCTPNPATQDNRCHTYLALDCRPAGPLELDRTEELRLWACPWNEWESLMRSGEVHHALVLTAFLHLFFWEGWPGLKRQLGAG